MRRLAERMTLIVIPRPPKRAFERLERTAGKLARYVLRGEDDGNITFLPDFISEGNNRLPVHSKKSVLCMKTAYIGCRETNFHFEVAICIALG